MVYNILIIILIFPLFYGSHNTTFCHHNAGNGSGDSVHKKPPAFTVIVWRWAESGNSDRKMPDRSL